MTGGTKKETSFVLVRKQEKKKGIPEKGIPVKYSKMHCEICDTAGAYWVGNNDIICRPCIIGLAKLLKEEKEENVAQ